MFREESLGLEEDVAPACVQELFFTPESCVPMVACFLHRPCEELTRCQPALPVD